MQQTAERAPIPTAPSFAGILAGLAAPASAAPERAPAWNDDGLADDVATLTYERALRAHARYKYAAPADLPDRSIPHSADPEPIHGDAAFSDSPPLEQEATARSSPSLASNSQPKAAFVPTALLERDLKCASITIRLSRAENAQFVNAPLRPVSPSPTISAPAHSRPNRCVHW